MDKDLERAEIQIAIHPDGTVRFEVSGVSGEACEAVERLLLEALRGEVLDRERTAEFWRSQGAAASATERLVAWLKRK